MEKNPHAGHRDRVKKEFVANGLENLPYHKVLEFLLFFGIPQRDTNEIAHALIERFGSFSQVFRADVTQLKLVKGMTENAAILIHMLPQVYRRIARDEQDTELVLNDCDKIADYLIPYFLSRPREAIYLLCFNNACKLLRCDFITEGNYSNCDFDVRKIIEIAYSCHATHIVIAHNHPTGRPYPSTADIDVTKAACSLFRKMGIELIDHIIVCQDRWESMAHLGALGVVKTTKQG